MRNSKLSGAVDDWLETNTDIIKALSDDVNEKSSPDRSVWFTQVYFTVETAEFVASLLSNES